MFPLYLCLAAAAEAEWWKLHEMRRMLGEQQGKVVAHWNEPGKAAYIAALVPGGGVRALVRLGHSEVRWTGERVKAPEGSVPVSSLDLEGVRTGDAVVLFHTEPRLTRSALSFDTGSGAPAKLRFIVTGLAPGTWEIWRNGWVVEIGVNVNGPEAVLRFDERPGSYFIRRLN